MRRITPYILALALTLGGCASSPTAHDGAGSMAEGIVSDDLDLLAGAAVDMVRNSAKAKSGSIGLQSAGDDTFTPRLVEGLSKAGYSVENGDRLRYQVGPFGEHLMLRVSIDGTDSSQIYGRDKTGKLKPIGPLSVWSVDP
jgi:hypothetical protein